MSTERPSQDRAPNAPGGSTSRERTCVGCGETVSAEDVRRAGGRVRTRAERRAETPVVVRPIVRLLVGPGGEIAVDAGTRGVTSGFGRGAYVHPEARCLAGAARGLARAAKSAVSIDGAPITGAILSEEIARAYERRAEGLLSAAKRARCLEIGSAAVTAAGKREETSLLIVATDAAAAAELSEVRRAVSDGRAIAWGTKRELARLISGVKERRTPIHAQAGSDPDSELGTVLVAENAEGQQVPDGSPDASAGLQQGGVGQGVGVGVAAVTDTRLADAILESRRIVESLRAAPVDTSRAASVRNGSSRTKPAAKADDHRRTGVGRSQPFSAGTNAGTSEDTRDASHLVGGAANLRGPARPGSPGTHVRSRVGSRRRGVKSA